MQDLFSFSIFIVDFGINSTISLRINKNACVQLVFFLQTYLKKKRLTSTIFKCFLPVMGGVFWVK